MTFRPEITPYTRAMSARSSLSRSSQIRNRPWATNMSNRSTDSLAGGQSVLLNQSRTSYQEK